MHLVAVRVAGARSWCWWGCCTICRCRSQKQAWSEEVRRNGVTGAAQFIFFCRFLHLQSSRPMNVRNGSTTEDVLVQLTARQLEEKKQAVAVVLVRSSTCFLYKLRKDVNGFLAWLMIMMMMRHDYNNRYYWPRQKNMQTTPTQTPRSPLLHCAYRRRTSSEPDTIRIRKVEDEAEDFMRK